MCSVATEGETRARFSSADMKWRGTPSWADLCWCSSEQREGGSTTQTWLFLLFRRCYNGQSPVLRLVSSSSVGNRSESGFWPVSSAPRWKHELGFDSAQCFLNQGGNTETVKCVCGTSKLWYPQTLTQMKVKLNTKTFRWCRHLCISTLIIKTVMFWIAASNLAIVILGQYVLNFQ